MKGWVVMRTAAKIISISLVIFLIVYGTWFAFFRKDLPRRIIDVSNFENRLTLHWINSFEPDYSGYGLRIYDPMVNIVSSELTVDAPDSIFLFVSLLNANRHEDYSELLILINGQPVPYRVDNGPLQYIYTHKLPPLGMINIPVTLDLSGLTDDENRISFLYLHYLDDIPGPKNPAKDFSSSINMKLYVSGNAPGSSLDELILTPTIEVAPEIADRQQPVSFIGSPGQISTQQQLELSVPQGQAFPITITAYDPNPVMYSTWFFIDNQPVWLDQNQPNLIWKSSSETMLNHTVMLPAQQDDSVILYAISIPLDFSEPRYEELASAKIMLKTR